MWCFENISWFKLTDDEQTIYDAVATMIKKDNLEMTFLVEWMYKHIKNREAFERLETPFIAFGEYKCYKRSERDNPICKSVEKYKRPGLTIPERSSAEGLSLDELRYLSHVIDKEIERAYFNGETNEDIFGDWCSMSDYKD